MKKLLILLFLFTSLNSFSQDKSIRRVSSLAELKKLYVINEATVFLYDTSDSTYNGFYTNLLASSYPANNTNIFAGSNPLKNWVKYNVSNGAGKLNISDTSTMLAAYSTKINKNIDSIAAHNARIIAEQSARYNADIASGSYSSGTLTLTKNDASTIPITGFSTGSSNTPSYVGSIYNANTWANTTSFTATNSGSASVTSSKIVFTGGAANSTLDYNYYSLLDHWKIGAKIKATSLTDTLADVIMHSVNGYQTFSVYAAVNLATGRLTIRSTNNSTVTQVAISTSTLSLTANDYVLVSLERNVDTVFAVARNITTNSSPVTCSYTYLTNDYSVASPNTGRYGLISSAGSFTLDSLSITSNELKYANSYMLTDSKGEYLASSWAKRWPQQVSNLLYPTVLGVGGSEGINEALLRVPEITALAPKTVLISVGRNDLINGINFDTLKARYQRFVTQLQTAGITVYHTNCFYELTTNQDAFSAWINTTFGSAVIDTYSPTHQPNVLAGDGVHFSQNGNDVVARTIIEAYKTTQGLNYSDVVRFNQLAATASSAVTGSGTTNYIPKFTGLSAIGNSVMQEVGSQSFRIGSTTGAPTPTPLSLSLGGLYGNSSIGNAANAKLLLWEDGTAADAFSWGVAANYDDFHAGATGGHVFTVNNGTIAMVMKSDGTISVGNGTVTNGKFSVYTGTNIDGITVDAAASGFGYLGLRKAGTLFSYYARAASAGQIYSNTAVDDVVIQGGSQALHLGVATNQNSAIKIDASNRVTFYNKSFWDAINVPTGTTGSTTINKPTGKVNFAAGSTSLVVTNSLVTTSSIIYISVEGTTPIATSYVPAAGSFTIYIPSQGSETKVGFFVIN